jgi:translocation and assembly module TamA
VRIGRSELRRLVASVPDQARELLEAEGYFNAKVVTQVSGDEAGGSPEVRVKVTPGPKARIGKVQFVFEGDLDNRLSVHEAEAQALVDDMKASWGLPAGKAFRQATWTDAKNGAMARMRAQGYPSASWSGTSATVDAQTNTVSLFLVADSGPLFKFGAVHIEGLQRQPASAILNVAPFRAGAVYREKQLLDWQERIQKLNLFDSIFISPDLDPAQAEHAPVEVKVHETAMQNATVGIGVSSDTGPRISGDHIYRNVFGLDWQSKTTLKLGVKESTGQLDLTSHPWPGRKRGLVSVQGSYLVGSDNAITSSQYLRVGMLREGERLERTDYVALQHAKVRSSTDVVVSNATALSLTGQWIFRDVDSQILPTTGTTSIAQLTGGRTYSALEQEGYFARTYARVTWYQPLFWQWNLTSRVEGGQVFAGHNVSVPDTLLFKAGGDDSVRGYAYQSLGVTRDGVLVGGKTLATGSLELAHPIWPTLPTVWGAVFVDAGSVADRISEMQANVGYGTGIRWRSPVGPLRLDVAYGHATHEWRIHFSVGISL